MRRNIVEKQENGNRSGTFVFYSEPAHQKFSVSSVWPSRGCSPSVCYRYNLALTHECFEFKSAQQAKLPTLTLFVLTFLSCTVFPIVCLLLHDVFQNTTDRTTWHGCTPLPLPAIAWRIDCVWAQLLNTYTQGYFDFTYKLMSRQS